MATETSQDPRVERSKSAVLEAAVDLLLEGGVGAVTVEAIVERSGVARSTIYRHWESRRELLLATFDALTPPPDDPRVDGPLRDRLADLLQSRARRIGSVPWAAAIPTLLDATSRDPELAGVRERLVEQHRGAFRRTLERAVEEGELPATTDMSEAISQIAGPMFYRLLISREPLDDAFARRVVDLFLASRQR